MAISEYEIQWTIFRIHIIYSVFWSKAYGYIIAITILSFTENWELSWCQHCHHLWLSVVLATTTRATSDDKVGIIQPLIFSIWHIYLFVTTGTILTDNIIPLDISLTMAAVSKIKTETNLPSDKLWSDLSSMHVTWTYSRKYTLIWTLTLIEKWAFIVNPHAYMSSKMPGHKWQSVPSLTGLGWGSRAMYRSRSYSFLPTGVSIIVLFLYSLYWRLGSLLQELCGIGHVTMVSITGAILVPYLESKPL